LVPSRLRPATGFNEWQKARAIAAYRAGEIGVEEEDSNRIFGVEDRKPRRVEKPWGHELWWADTDVYAGKLLHVEAGQRLSLQLHREKDESSYLLSGRLLLTRGPSAEDLHEQEIGPGYAWRVEPEIVHCIEAVEDSVVLEVSTPHLDDVVRLQDRYGREGS
jgi:mannose-6-phosphate isomerase-like protein (cupin superfamily)